MKTIARSWVDRFWPNVRVTNTCWEWTGRLNHAGYGVLDIQSVPRGAHRLSYELHTGGPIPAGLELDHLCRVRNCVRPDHLEPVTHLENIRRIPAELRSRFKGVCRKGHPVTEENSYFDEKKKSRRCRICRRARYARNKALDRKVWS